MSSAPVDDQISANINSTAAGSTAADVDWASVAESAGAGVDWVSEESIVGNLLLLGIGVIAANDLPKINPDSTLLLVVLVELVLLESLPNEYPPPFVPTCDGANATSTFCHP